MRWLGGSALVLLAVIAAGFVAQRLFGSDAEHPMSEAREAIKALPYGVTLREGPGGILVGTLSGRNSVVHFAVADSPDASGIPAALRRGESGAGGAFWVWDDAERGSSRQTKVEREERAEVGADLEEALRPRMLDR
jgi:hypothetical protein